MRITEVCLAIFLINIIFGYWRSNTKRFTLFWALAIHVPMAIAIILRVELLGWNWALMPAFIAAFFFGQFAGGWIRRKLAVTHGPNLGSFLFKDLFRIWFRKSKSPGSPSLNAAGAPCAVKVTSTSFPEGWKTQSGTSCEKKG